MLSCLELYVTGQSLVGTTLGISESRSYHIIRWIRKWCNLVKEQPQTDGRRLKTLIETPKTPHRDVASPFFGGGGGDPAVPQEIAHTVVVDRVLRSANLALRGTCLPRSKKLVPNLMPECFRHCMLEFGNLLQRCKRCKRCKRCVD